MSGRTLYICYFGIREPLVQTQVLPYLRELIKDDVKVSLLTFEPRRLTEDEISADRQALDEIGIDWHFLRYHKRFSALATSYDILNGARFVRRFPRRHGANILHARSHIPMAMVLIANRTLRLPVIFDLRGLMAEEYVDAGIWREGSPAFRAIKWVEQQGLKRATQVVVLTEKMKRFLVDRGIRTESSVNVIPCCVDLSRLAHTAERKSERFELVYAGSVTGLYMLDEMGKFFVTLRERWPDAFFRILTAADPEFVYRTFSRLEIPSDDYSVAKASPDEVLNIVSRAHLAISFRKPTFSQIAASPTKVPEYLACGVPVVVNDGVGDTTEIIKADVVGTVLNEFTVEAYRAALDELVPLLDDELSTRKRCMESARRRFDLENVGGARYRALYRKILQA
jgi:glycosyltransferase involved in cell wall biosynthesis